MTDLVSNMALMAHDHGIGPGGGGLWFLFPLLWFVIIVGVIFAVKRTHWNKSGRTIVREAYARGEITEEEYRQRLATLKKHR